MNSFFFSCLVVGHKKEYKTLASGFESIAASFVTDNAPSKTIFLTFSIVFGSTVIF